MAFIAISGEMDGQVVGVRWEDGELTGDTEAVIRLRLIESDVAAGLTAVWLDPGQPIVGPDVLSMPEGFCAALPRVIFPTFTVETDIDTDFLEPIPEGAIS